MKVLVVCPTYGRIPFLNRMLASFLSQTYDDKHLVIVNDDKNVKLVCNESNVTCVNLDTRMLLPQKRNIGNALNYSDIIMPYDDDDIFLPNRIANHVKMHTDNTELGAFFKVKGYLLFGDIFEIGNCAPTAISYTRKAWHSVEGYQCKSNIGEDQDFLEDIATKIILQDGLNPDYVYNYGNINYHTCGTEDWDIEKIAAKQLVDMDLFQKEYVITPDYEEFNKFVELDRMYKENPAPIKIKHVSFGKIDIL